ncbi:hypothetical protein BGZ82_000245 [Podila clonocystis]|nr:hypothetical protein BGZ82_000245 [Podila clonocystis]
MAPRRLPSVAQANHPGAQDLQPQISPPLLSKPLALDVFHLSQPSSPASGPLGAIAPEFQLLHKRAPQAPPPPTTSVSTDTKPTKLPRTTTTSSSKSMSTATSSIPSPTPTSIVDPKGDFALFGKPSVVGAFNLTSGILIYSAFLILFIGSVGSATWQRSRYRNQFRQQQRLMAAESGRIAPGKGNKKSSGDDSELSDAALFKQASISKRALMKDVGPGGVMAANDAVKTKIAAANGAGRSFDNRDGQQVRFGEAQPNNNTGTGRTGGMKKTPARSNSGSRGQDAQGYEMNTYGQNQDPLQYYQDNHDTTDYSRPPLTESVDPYYSSGSSHGGYLDQVEENFYNDKSNTSPQMPRATYNPRTPGASTSPQPQHQQPVFVQRTNSSRMPQNELHDANNVYRSNSGRGGNGSPNIPSRSLERSGSNPSRIATQGLVDRSGSGGHPRSSSPDGAHMSRNGSSASNSRARMAPSPTQTHPTPIARSNSTRLPPQMRGGTPQPGPSGLSQQTNNYDYM